MKLREKVILRRVPEYDRQAVSAAVLSGIEELGLTDRIRGRVTIKPNVVMAHHRVAPSAFTRREFLEGLADALYSAGGGSLSITIAEKSGAGLPTSRMLMRAGYRALRRSHGIKLRPIEEAPKKRVLLSKGRVHSRITTSPDIIDADFLVYAPKLKSNVLSQGITAAIKLNIGILRDRERMWNHNHLLDEKIVDLLEVGWPDFIATDAVEAGIGGNQLTEHGRPLGLIVMASNPVAHDSVCARILNLDPQAVDHIRLAHERGYGPLAAEEIEITGDVSLAELQALSRGWDLGYIRVDEVKTPLTVLCGEPYCRGGCHGVFLDWLYMIKDRKPALWKKLPPWTVVIGDYPGDVTAERTMVIGRCSRVRGKFNSKIKRHIRRCPPKHKDIVLSFLIWGRIVNPVFRVDLIYDAYVCLFFSWCRRLLRGRI